MKWNDCGSFRKPWAVWTGGVKGSKRLHLSQQKWLSMSTPVFKWQWQTALAAPSTVVTAQWSETKKYTRLGFSAAKHQFALCSASRRFLLHLRGDTVSTCSLLISVLSCDALTQVEKPWEVLLISWQTLPLRFLQNRPWSWNPAKKRNPCWLTMSWR